MSIHDDKHTVASSSGAIQCTYTKVGYVKDQYPRFEYKTDCGLRYIQLEHEQWDGKRTVIVDPSGKCMKCQREIKIATSNEVVAILDELLEFKEDGEKSIYDLIYEIRTREERK
jgi:hypothetical protein